MKVVMSKNIKASIDRIYAENCFLSWGLAQDYLKIDNRVEKLAELQDDNGKIVGWSLIYTGYLGYPHSCWVYVADRYRCQGYGQRLVNQVKKGYTNLNVCRYDSGGIKRKIFWAKVKGKNIL